MKLDGKGWPVLEYQGNAYKGTQLQENEKVEWASAVAEIKAMMFPSKMPKPPESLERYKYLSRAEKLIIEMRNEVNDFILR